MKTAERGPFSRLRWFCKDGAVLPPQGSACLSHGGGWQHGEWSSETTALRAQGYLVANVLAGVDAPAMVAQTGFPEAFAQLLVERFLVGADNGWIFRRAQFYRGALQDEDEREGARQLLLAMLASPDWVGYRYPALRAGARLLPHGKDTASIQKVRELASTLSELDATFLRLRAKIHGTPEAQDAARVREHAARSGRRDITAQYEELAAQIEKVYVGPPLAERLEQEAAVMTRAPWLQQMLREAARAGSAAASPAARYVACATLLGRLRDALPRVGAPGRPAARPRPEPGRRDRGLPGRRGAARRGGGHDPLRAPRPPRRGQRCGLRHRSHEREAARRAERHLLEPVRPGNTHSASTSSHSSDCRSPPAGAPRPCASICQEAMEKLTEIEPLADLFIQDQLRGSPLLFYAHVLDGLLRDANRLAGVHHKLYGRDVGVGLNALNPGLARGILNARPNMQRLEEFRADGIYVLPETVADLPPLAGILTAGSGNPLSHVQLLARNLGIPNVAVDEALMDEVRSRDSHRVVLAVSPGGVVELAEDGPSWDALLGEGLTRADELLIRPDLQKLDLAGPRLHSPRAS